jgi:hypothetical protein
MRRKAFPRMDVVRREDKEARITAFIEAFIAGGVAPNQSCLLVARSLRSPVARAVSALVKARRLGFNVEVIFSSFESELGERGTGATAWAHSVRLARNPKLLDAHELLVLGPATSWFGDCMRREPDKSDAWERFAADCEETARHARRSFERLWQASEPVAADARAGVRRAGSAAADSIRALPRQRASAR